MSKRANKQRMRLRLCAALAYHDPEFAFELAVMGPKHYTHKQLKDRLRRVPAMISIQACGREYIYDGVSGLIVL